MENGLLEELVRFDQKYLKSVDTVVRRDIAVKPPAFPGGRYAHSPDEDITEYYDELETLHQKVKKVAELVRAAKHIVVYTGAGVSTSTSLPDFRGPKGVWTLAAKGTRPEFDKKLEELHPTICHMNIVQLEKLGIVKHLVSTNTDGLHMRSGFPREKLSELHGNAYLERCRKCNAEFLRDHNVCKGRGHATGNKCEKPGCDGDLMNTIVNFGENLPEKELNAAIGASNAADLTLVMGTSMRVRPACQLPTYCLDNEGKMVIVNLQKTPYDSVASTVVRCTTDDFMTLLMEELKLDSLLQTPTGLEHNLRTKDQIDEFQTKKIEEIKQARLYPKQELVNQPSFVESLPAPPVHKISRRGVFFVDQMNEEKMKIEGFNLKDLVYIKECKNSLFDLNKKCTKLMLERCDNVVLNINSPVLTGTLEMIECTNVTLNVFVPIFTMQLDSSTAIKVHFNNESLMHNVVWHCTKELSIKVKDVTGEIKHAFNTGADVVQNSVPNMDLTAVQFITHLVNGKLDTEVVIREGAGYATTAREKKIMDDRQERNKQIMVEFLNRIMSISDSPKTTADPKGDEEEYEV
jgi:NAD-dependent SIR2 family protein deacetylase